MAGGKGPAGMGFEVFLKCRGFGFVAEGYEGHSSLPALLTMACHS